MLAEDADWRPEHDNGLAALDAEMAPILVQFDPLFEAVVQDFTVMSAPFVFNFTNVESAAKDIQTDMQARVDAANQLPVDVAAMLTLAHDAMAVLDSHVVEYCWADYAADLRTGWLAYGDSVQSVQVGDLQAADKDIGVARYLLGARGDLLHSQALKDCAS